MMAESATMTSRVLEALVASGHLTVEQSTEIESNAALEGVTAGGVMAKRKLITSDELAKVLEENLGLPRVDLASYEPDAEALAMLSASDAQELCALPLFEIEGMLTVAIAHAFDVFELDSLGTRLNVEVEAVLADSVAVVEAITHYYGSAEDASHRTVEVEDEPPPSPAATLPRVPVEDETQFMHVAETIEQVVGAEVSVGQSAIDLDVLAVADAGRVATLVFDILEHAVRKGASRIHILPYREDFFLVYRIEGRLEKIASAPLSMQGALVDAIKGYARMGSVPATHPALGRLHSRIADVDLVLTVSAVPTIAGQRVVLSLAADNAEPRSLSDLGMSEAEARALQAMVERGRGILLVCAPVAGGRSSTYYALLAHAAASGRTAYSVEYSVDYELPAVAQVLVNPGSSVGAASYFAVGMRQDTDVIAIDSLRSVEDIHLAVEAAGFGKLVIATYSGGDIVSGVRRMLDLGVEPTSLAAALTFGVGQRLVRTNCPSCSVEERSPIASAIPGAPEDIVSRSGSGCPNCTKTGFSGATGIFEVLPFTEPIRAAIAKGGSAAEIAGVAKAAGMRPMIGSGLARVREGRVSAEELNRVLRFSE